MDQIDFDTEKSLQAALDARASASSSKLSADPASINLSLPTRKRLIRKPLPDVPNRSASASMAGSSAGARDSTGNSSSSSSSVQISGTGASSMLTVGDVNDYHTAMQRRGTHSDILSRHDAPRHHAASLEASRSKAREVLEEQRIELSWWPNIADVAAIDQETCRAPKLPEGAEDTASIVLSQENRHHLENVLHHCMLSLSEDHQTLAVETDTLLGPLEACIATLTESQALAALQRTASVLWRVDALVRSSEQQGSGNKTDSSMGALGMRWPKLAWRGSGARLATGAESDGTGMDSSLLAPSSVQSSTMRAARKRDVAMRLLSNAFWMAGVGVGDGAGLGIGLDMAAEAALSGGNPTTTSKAAPAAPRKSVGAAPNLLLRGAAPTVALSKTENEDEKKEASESPSEQKAEVEKQSETRLPDEKEGEKRKVESLHAEEHSTLTERLAMQLKSGTRPSSKSTSPDRTSRSSMKADAAAGSAEEAKMTVCKIMVNVRDDRPFLGSEEGEGKDTVRRRRRSETVTVTAAERRRMNASTKSDATVKFKPTDEGHAVVGEASVKWQPDVYEGNELLLNPLKSDMATKDDDGSDESGVNLIGGTFEVHADSQEHADTIATILDVGLFVASALALEQAFLQNCGMRDAYKAEEVTSILPSPDGKRQEQADSGSANAEDKLRSPRELDGFHPNDPSSRSYSRWSRGLWNIIQSGHHVTSSKEESNGNHAIGFPRSKTVESSHKGSGGRKAAYTRLGKMITSFGGGTRRPLTAEDDVIKPLAVAEEREDSDSRGEEYQEADSARKRTLSDTGPSGREVKTASARKLPPLSVSPHICGVEYVADGTDKNTNSCTFLDAFLDRQSFALLVEGFGGPLNFIPEVNDGNHGKGRRLATPSLQSKAVSSKEGAIEGGSTSSSFSVASSQRTASTAASRATANTTTSNTTNATSATSATNATSKAKDGRQGHYRREISFYQHGGPSRDVSLGQAIEEAAARAVSLSLEGEVKKTKAEKDSKKSASDATKQRLAEGCSQSVEGFKVAQFVYASDRISMFATVLPPPTPPKPFDDAGEDSKKDVEVQAHPPASASSSNESADAAAAANAPRANLDTARAAGATAKSPESGTKLSTRSMIYLWTTSMRTGKQTAIAGMTDATYLLSFGKFLEAIVQQPRLFANVIQSGEYLLLDGQAVSDSKFDLVRLFKIGRVLIKIQVQPIYLFNLLIEGPVVVTQDEAGGEKLRRIDHMTEERGESETESEQGLVDEDEKRAKRVINRTRLEIQRFFASTKEQVSSLEHLFVARELDERGKTIKKVPSKDVSESDEAPDATSTALTLLSRLKTSLRSAEFELYSDLKEADASLINDVRKHFLDQAKSSKQRLEAWAGKHLTKDELKRVGVLTYSEPEYAQGGRHTFPGSHIVVRESEPLSIIAFSLSSVDFMQEVNLYRRQRVPEPNDSKRADVLQWRTSVAPGTGGSQLSSSLASSSASTRSSTSTATSGATATGGGEKRSELDPDVDEVFHQPEPVRVHMKRKKRTRDASILSLTLRRVGSSISSHSDSQAHTPTSEVPPRINVRDDDDADDDDDTISSKSTAGDIHTPSSKKTEEPENSSTPTPSRILAGGTGGAESSGAVFRNDGEIASLASNDTFRAQITQVSGRPTDSLSSLFSAAGDETASETSQPTIAEHEMSNDHASRSGLPDPENATSGSSLQSLWSPMAGFNSLRGGRREPGGLPASHPSPLSLANRTVSDSVLMTTSTLLHSSENQISSSDAAEGLPNSSSTPRVAPGPSPASPHIKHNLFHGNTKVSCVSWFAEDFAALRAKWGVTNDFVESLSRCKSWSAAGGKSKSGFFMTLDENWIAKQLLTVWSVDEKEAFLEFAPAYLRYMMNSVQNECPTLLVKIAGVYSIKIKDVKTGETKLKMSVQVLENVFAGDDGQSIRFDLKGIRDRRVKAGSQATDEDRAAVWWDGEWIDSFQSRAYVPEACKNLFRRALQNDLNFLTASNVMDYSLLVGVTEPQLEVDQPSDGEGEDKESSSGKPNRGTRATPMKRERDDGNTFRCRLVDFLGAWTLVKQLESSSKKALKQHAPTVIPPADYAIRFGEALDSYFVACPGATIATTMTTNKNNNNNNM